MSENRRKGTFIPCGDAMEKMDEIHDDDLKDVSGGASIGGCSLCGGRMMFALNKETNTMNKLVCMNCGWEKMG